jgi:hypothetical protein
VNIFDEAAKVVTERGKVYGPPILNFARIADLLNILLDAKLARPLDPSDVAIIGVATKLARLMETPGHHDSVLDAIGYLYTYEECRDGMDGR